MVANTEANGRFHSDWLTMLYPRLRLREELLLATTESYASRIDDSEVSQLPLLMRRSIRRSRICSYRQVWAKVVGGESSKRVLTTNMNTSLV